MDPLRDLGHSPRGMPGGLFHLRLKAQVAEDQDEVSTFDLGDLTG